MVEKISSQSLLFAYILRYKIKIIFIFFLLLGTTLTSGVSMSLVIPLLDSVLVEEEKERAPLFLDIEQTTRVTAEPWQTYEIKIKKKINQVWVGMNRVKALDYVAMALVFLLCIKGMFMFLKEYSVQSVSHSVIRDLRNDLYTHLNTLSLDFFHRCHVGELMARLTSDTSLVHNAVVKGWSMLVFQLFNILMYLGIAFYLHWKLTLLALVILPILVVPIVVIGQKVRKISQKSQQKLGDLSTILQETLTGVKEMKAFCAEAYEQKKFFAETRRFFRMTMKSVKRDAVLSPFMEVAVGISISVFMVIGGREVLQGRLTKGEFALFLVAVVSLLQPFKRISKAYSMLQQSLASADRVFDLFREVPSVQESLSAIDLPDFSHTIEFKDVAVSYDQEDMIIENASFEVTKGSVFAFVGKSGAGKSSLVNLLPRFYDPYKGSVCIDGCNVNDVTFSSLREQIGIVSQDVTLFHDSIAANIAYGVEHIDMDRVQEAARFANASDFIENLENAYLTLVGERGCRLSGGERQRIAIARAIYKNPPILILDEATSALDTQTERLVQDALDRLMDGRTVLVIAHRLSTVTHADQILVLDQERVVQQGTHSELLSQEGLYQELYKMQFQKGPS